MSNAGIGAFSSTSDKVGVIADKVKKAADVLSSISTDMGGASSSAAVTMPSQGETKENIFETLAKEIGQDLKTAFQTSAANLLKDPVSGIFAEEKNGGENAKEDDQQKQMSGEGTLGGLLSGKLQGVFDKLLGKFDGVFGGLGDTLKGLFGDLTNSLGGMLDGLLGNLGGLLGGDKFGGLGALFSSVGSLFGFAGGGRVQPGVPAIVGERGPELIVPSRASTVMNAADSRGAMRAQGVSVNQTVNFDLVPSPTISAMIDAKKPEIEQAAIQGTLRALNRGGVR